MDNHCLLVIESMRWWLAHATAEDRREQVLQRFAHSVPHHNYGFSCVLWFRKYYFDDLRMK